VRFPSDFPEYARAAVIAEQVRATDAFNVARDPRTRPMPPPGRSHPEHITHLARQYVLRIFATFAHQAYELGRVGQWTATHVDEACREFLRLEANDVWAEFGTLPIQRMITDFGHITSEAWAAFTASKEWKQYQAELLEIADSQSTAPLHTKEISSADVETKSRTHAEVEDEPEVNELRRRNILLAEYKAAAGQPSNRKIYNARNSGIHKPEFYDYFNGDLKAESQTFVNFESFLRAKKPPIPRTATPRR
jgi:hypothetical protein